MHLLLPPFVWRFHPSLSLPRGSTLRGQGWCFCSLSRICRLPAGSWHSRCSANTAGRLSGQQGLFAGMCSFPWSVAFPGTWPEGFVRVLAINQMDLLSQVKGGRERRGMPVPGASLTVSSSAQAAACSPSLLQHQRDPQPGCPCPTRGISQAMPSASPPVTTVHLLSPPRLKNPVFQNAFGKQSKEHRI